MLSGPTSSGVAPAEILLLGSLGAIEGSLESEFVLHRFWREPDRAAFLKEKGPQIHGLVSFGHVEGALFAALPKLAIIANMSAGYDGIDISAAKARGIVVTNAGGANAVDVAEHAFGLILDVARAITAGDRYIRAGRWPTEGRPRPTRRLSGRRLGILGLGNIGAALARRATAFDMPVVYHSRTPREDAPYRHVDSVIELARNADILAVTAPGGQGTRHLVGRAALDALGPRGILVNVSRGSIVDQAALIDALTEGRLGGAGLDVLDSEPRAPDRLLALPNVVVTPHVAGATHEALAAVIDVGVANLRAYFSGAPVLHRVA